MLFTYNGIPGATYYLTVERLSDGYYRNTSGVFQNSLAFNDKKVALTGGTGPNSGSFSVTIATSWDDGDYRARIHNASGTRVLGSSLFTIVDEEELTLEKTLEAQSNYTARLEYTRGIGHDIFGVAWELNGTPITSGISGSTLTIYNMVGATHLSTPLDIISGTPISTNVVSGARLEYGKSYLAVATATIDGTSRSYQSFMGRDYIG